MSVNAHITLSHDAWVIDVAQAIAVLSGIKPEWRTKDKFTFLWVPGMTMSASSGWWAAHIKINGQLVDGEAIHEVTLWFEDPEHPLYSRLLMPLSTPYWLAIGKRLIDFFGGVLIYQDHLPKESLHIPKRRPHYNHNDDEQFSIRQDELFRLEPLRASDIQAMRPYAAYPDPT